MPKRKIASLPGIECDEVIHSILDVMYANAQYTVIQRAMHIHPSVTELITTMLGELKPLERLSSPSGVHREWDLLLKRRRGFREQGWRRLGQSRRCVQG